MKQMVKKVGEYATLYKDDKTGIAWVEDGSTRTGHSAHPNISSTGSVAGMKNLGYWGKEDRTVRSHGWIYNIDHLVVTSELDKIAADACMCTACQERRNKEDL